MFILPPFFFSRDDWKSKRAFLLVSNPTSLIVRKTRENSHEKVPHGLYIHSFLCHHLSFYGNPAQYSWASLMVLVVKNPPANAGDITDAGLIPGLGKSPEGGHGNPFQDSCRENPMDRGAWWATVHEVAKSWTWLKQLSKPTPVCLSGKSHGQRSLVGYSPRGCKELDTA